MGYWEIYTAIQKTNGTDKYLCPEYAEERLIEVCKGASDEDLRAAVNGYRNRFKKMPQIDIKNQSLKKRFEALNL